MITKLRRQSGETITEVLLAIAIVGIAIAIMSGLITTSARLNGKARTDTEQLYTALNSAEGAETPLSNDVVITVTVTSEGGTSKTVDFSGAKLYGIQDKLYSYDWEKGG